MPTHSMDLDCRLSLFKMDSTLAEQEAQLIPVTGKRSLVVFVFFPKITPGLISLLFIVQRSVRMKAEVLQLVGYVLHHFGLLRYSV